VRFSELFETGKDTLVIYSFMFPRYSGDTRPGLSEGETARLRLSATSCPSCTSILDSLDGAAPHLAWRLTLAVNVFIREPDQFRHTWSSELMYALRDEGLEARHVDSIWPHWNVLDVTPDGRGNESNFPALGCN
jgi:predicted dithiol-disulfide oxidoreductase (DUF899 family)